MTVPFEKNPVVYAISTTVTMAARGISVLSSAVSRCPIMAHGAAGHCRYAAAGGASERQGGVGQAATAGNFQSDIRN